MTEEQISIFMTERKWDYRGIHHTHCCTWLLLIYYTQAFGFTAALLESLPIIGLVFTISNRIGAAMWAHGV